MIQTKKKELYTPKELLKKYPNTPFNESDLGRLLRLELLNGRQGKRESLIDEVSFLKLIEHRNTVIDDKKIHTIPKYQ